MCDDFFCTGDIVNNNQCIETFEKFLNNKLFDIFDFGEIKETMDLMHMKLMTFKKLLEELIMICQFFIIKKVKTQTSIIRKGKCSKLFSKTEIIRDFMQQLKKVVIKKIFISKKKIFISKFFFITKKNLYQNFFFHIKNNFNTFLILD